MRAPKIINYSDVKVILRKDFYDEFDEKLKTIEKETGATLFSHNIIKNYRDKEHRVSCFCKSETWSEVYWDKYRNDNPLEKTIHKVVQKNDFGVVSWELGHNGSSCSQERKKVTQLNDGVVFSFKKEENYIESFDIGWKTFDVERLDTDYIAYLTSLIKPIRDYHWAVHNNI